jgi:hypothetical protein
MSALVDHVAEGLASMRPRQARDPAFVSVAGVMLKMVQQFDDMLAELADLFSLDHDRAPRWVLRYFGNLLGVPDSPAYSKALYRQLLRARRVARRSRGTYDDVVKLADELRAPGTIDHATINITHPEALQVAIPNLAKALEDKVRGLILPYIQETTDLSVLGITDTEGGLVPQEWFKFGPLGPGFAPGPNAGKLAPDL